MSLKSIRTPAGAIVLLASLFLLQVPALADIPMYYNGPNGAVWNGVYTSPYQVTINGVTQYVVCDDATADIQPGLSWRANELTLPQVGDTGPQKFTHTTNPEVTFDDGSKQAYAIRQMYDAAGWLSLQILANWRSWNPTTQAEYSFAVWQIFDPNTLNQYFGNHPTERAQVGVLMHDALDTPHNPDMRIYTPDPLSASQEFIGAPEGTTIAFLAFDFLSLPAMILFVRRRRRQA